MTSQLGMSLDEENRKECLEHLEQACHNRHRTFHHVEYVYQACVNLAEAQIILVMSCGDGDDECRSTNRVWVPWNRTVLLTGVVLEISAR